MSQRLIKDLIQDARITFDPSIEKMPAPSSAFLHHVRGHAVDFGHSVYARAAMMQLDFLPSRPSRELQHDFVIRIDGRSLYFTQANATRHLYNILFASLLPGRPDFTTAHPTIRELVLLAYCDRPQLAVRILKPRWPRALAYVGVIEYCPTLKIQLIEPRALALLTRSAGNGEPFTVRDSTTLVLALRAMFDKTARHRRHCGFNQEYADRVFDLFVMYLALENEPDAPDYTGQIKTIGSSRYTFASGLGSDLSNAWVELTNFVHTREGSQWTRSVYELQKLMYTMASGVARAFHFVAKRANYAQFNASQVHSQEEVAFARDFATACMLVNSLADLAPGAVSGAPNLTMPSATMPAFARNQLTPRNVADFYTIKPLYREQVYHFLHRSLAAHELVRAKTHTHDCAWILVCGVAADRMRDVIGAAMSRSDMEHLVLYVGELHDPHLGFGSVVGLRCWYDGEAAKEDAVSLFSIAITTKVRIRNFIFPGYTVPIYPFVARLILNMPMSSEWSPVGLALGSLPGFALHGFSASYDTIREALKSIATILFLAEDYPTELPSMLVGRFINNMLWHLLSPNRNKLIVLHVDMSAVAKAIKQACVKTPTARTKATKFFVFLNEEAVVREERGYTPLGNWTAFVTSDLAKWMSFAQLHLLSKTTKSSTKGFARTAKACAAALRILCKKVRREPRELSRRQSVSSDPGTPRQNKLGTLPYSSAGNASLLMSPLVRRSSTPTHERGPFRSIDPDYKSDLYLPFGRVLGLIEHLHTTENTTDQSDVNEHSIDSDYDAFDVRTARLRLLPFHQTAMCMVSPLRAVGLPESGALIRTLDHGLDWCVSLSAAASAQRHRLFRPDMVQLQESRNRSLYNEYGTLDDIITEDLGSNSPVYARPPTPPPAASSGITTAAATAAARPTLVVLVPPPTDELSVDDFFGGGDDEDEDDPMMWENPTQRPDPTGMLPISPPSPVFASAPASPVYETVIQVPTPSRKRVNNEDLQARLAKRSKRHTRPRLPDALRRSVQAGQAASSVPETLQQIANVAGAHHQMKLCFE